MIYDNILAAVGRTPLVRLNHLTGICDAEVLVKVEGLNIGGSIKTRTALQMIEAAEQEGILTKDSVIVEPTSGNQGIGLALVGAVKGYRVIIIMPDSVSEERRLLIRQYGAELMLIHDDNNIGECIDRCIETAKQLCREHEDYFMPDQFSNYNNIRAHQYHTALEILMDTGIRTCSSGRRSRSMPRSFPAAPSAPTFRWVSETDLSRQYWIRRSFRG